MLNVKKLLTKMLQKTKLLDDRTTLRMIPEVTNFTPNNCTGTVSGFLYIRQAKNGQAGYIIGRINIDNFVRTGSNPGVSFTLPSEWPVSASDFYATIGFPAQFPREFLTFHVYAGTRNARIYPTESYNNMANGALTFQINSGNLFVIPF